MAHPDPAALPPDPAAWIGRKSQRSDVITPRLVASFRATLTPHLAPDEDVPPGLLWCLAPDVVEPADLGPDGHLRTGLSGPVMPYPRRMWAGGELVIHGNATTGEVVTKTSTVADIALKSGSTGRLAFLTMHHDYHAGERLVMAERQDIVYREPPVATVAPPPAPPAEFWDAIRNWTAVTDPTLLFRYSALTFNGHRIHYDAPYATDVEGYPGLVVHGPLQATWMLNLATVASGAVPRRFSYRGRAPLICGTPARVEARRGETGLELRVVDRDHRITMVATAER